MRQIKFIAPLTILLFLAPAAFPAAGNMVAAERQDWPLYEILHTSTKMLRVVNTGIIGSDHEGESLDIPGDCDIDLPVPNADMYLFCASPMIGWNDGIENHTYTTMFTQSWDEPGTFTPISDIVSESFPDYNQVSFSCATTDDRFAFDATFYGPTEGNDFVIIKYEVYPYGDPAGLDDVYIGMILDWDVPTDEAVVNASGYDLSPLAIWQRGVEIDPADEDLPHDCPILENQRYAGIAMISDILENGWTAENAPMLEGSGYNQDSLYNRMNTNGVKLYYKTGADSVVDLHTGITVKEVDLTSGSSYGFVVALATSNDGYLSLENQLLTASDWAVAHGIAEAFVCDCRPGDANGDGQVNVGDAVYIVSHVFKGGAAPTPYPVCSGDANGDCQCNVGDVVYIIAHVYAFGTPAPTCLSRVARCGRHF